VEQYLIESLEQVRSEIRNRREVEYKEAKLLYQAQLMQLAAPKGFKANNGLEDIASSGISEPVPPKFNIPLSEMSLEDRERILRLLFAKINNQAFCTHHFTATTFIWYHTAITV